MALTTYSSMMNEDIMDIINKEGVFKPYFLFSTTIHTEEKSLDENDGVVIAGHDIVRDYKENEFDQSTLDFMIKPGTWLYDIYPYADALEVTVKVIKQHRLFNATTGVEVEERYKLVYLPDANQSLPTEPKESRSALNQMTPLYVRFQIVSRVNMAARVKTTQGVVSQKISETNKDMKADSILKSLLSHELKKLQIAGEVLIKGLDIEKSLNLSPMKKLIIPTGTSIMDLPFLMQEDKGGMYPAGVGSYMQRYTPNRMLQPQHTMFVYSLYDGSKVNNTEQRIIFFIPPDGTHSTGSRTYDYDAGLLKVVAYPIPGLYDVKENALRSEGDGFRSADSGAFSNKPVEVKEKGPSFTQRGLVTEVVVSESKDGLVNASYKGIDKNHYVNASRVLARKGSYVQIVVENLDPDYIFPGAGCKVLNEPVEGILLKLEGVIHKVVVKYKYQNTEGLGEFTMLEHALTSTTFIDVFITNVEENESF